MPVRVVSWKTKWLMLSLHHSLQRNIKPMIASSSSEARSQLDFRYERLVIQPWIQHRFWKPSFFMSNFGAETGMSQWAMDGKWAMSFKDEWLLHSLKMKACTCQEAVYPSLCLYQNPCMIGILTSFLPGAGFLIDTGPPPNAKYLRRLQGFIQTLSINAMANWCIHEITQCGHYPRKATCVTLACHRVLLSRPGGALLPPAYGIADGAKFHISC